MEGHGVLRTLDVDPGRGVRSRNMNRPDMEHNHRGDHEGQQVMQREEAVERGIVGRIAAEEPGLDRFADKRNSDESPGDDLGAPEAHLAPWQDITTDRKSVVSGKSV